MRFKQFMEMAHIILDEPLYYHDKKIDCLDMHFEDYANLSQFSNWSTKFFAKMPDNDVYIVYENGNAVIKKNNLPQWTLFNKYKLPPVWWNFAEIIFSDGTIKNEKFN